MKQYIVTIEPMQQHINGGKTKTSEFPTFIKAIDYMIGVCDMNDIPFDVNLNNPGKERNLEAGGIGHDYRITLEVVQMPLI